ncbi:hypothetical protein QQP08_008838 [Theobroma cacao]|nr:hypothetical protein QQP08_008838 [Theobroma cacao]
MENVWKKWRFKRNEQLSTSADETVRGTLTMLNENINKKRSKTYHSVEPRALLYFRTCPIAEQAVADAFQSAKFNSYSPFVGILPVMSGIEGRHCNLLHEKGWEVDLDIVEALTDENIANIVIINPKSPCRNVVEKARKLEILVIIDKVYEHLTFESNPFVPTIIAEQIKACLNIGSDPVTFIQGALPQNLEKTNKDFFSKYINILKQTSDILCDRIKEIPCITCPQKPKGSVFIMVKLDLSLLEGIDDDMDFCAKLAMEESVSILPAA